MVDIVQGARELAWSFRTMRDPLLSSFEREVENGATDMYRRVRTNVTGGTLQVQNGRLSRSLLSGRTRTSNVYEAFVRIGGRITPHTYAHEFGATIHPKGHSHLAIPWQILRSGGQPRYYSPTQTPAGLTSIQAGAPAYLYTGLKIGSWKALKKKSAKGLSSPGFQGTPATSAGEKKLLGFWKGLAAPKMLSAGASQKKLGKTKHVVLKAKWALEKKGQFAGTFRPTFLVRGRRPGSWVVMFRSTKGAVPIFTLVPSVSLRPRLGFWSSFEASALSPARLLPRLGVALERQLRKRAAVGPVPQP